jgi:AraC-like DNA-binding protein
VTAILVCSARDRPRQLLARAWPRGRAQITVVRTPDAIDTALATALVDAVVVDLSVAGTAPPPWRAIEHAAAHAPVPACAFVSPRTVDGGTLARLHASGVATVLLDGVDDALLRVLLQPVLLSTRFVQRADGLLAAHHFGSLAEAVWRIGVSHLGRLTSVATVAKQLGISREHLARTLRQTGAPGAKHLLELVRLLVVQLQLAEGVALPVAATRVGYSSVSHLARAARAATGMTPRQWAGVSGDALIAAAVHLHRNRSPDADDLDNAS